MTTWHMVWRLLRAHPRLALLNVALATAVAALDLLPGPVTRAFFDRLATPGRAGVGVEALIAALLALALARTLVKTTAVLASELHQFTAAGTVRRNLLARILARPDDNPARDAAGETLGRFRDDAGQLALFLGLLSYGVSVLLFALGATALLLRIDARLTVLVFLPLAVVAGVAQVAFARLARYRQASREAAGRVTGAIGEMFEAVGAVQVAGAEAHVIGHFRWLNEERGRRTVRDAILTRGLNAAFAATVSLGTGLTLLFAADALRAGTFTVGDFALFGYYLGFVSEFTRFCGGALAGSRQTGVAVARLAALLRGAPPATLAAATPASPADHGGRANSPSRPAAERLSSLAATGLSYGHPTSGRGIAGVDLRLARGETVVIAGRIGAGKTTLLRVLLGQLPAQAGELRWNDRVVADPAAWCVPPRVAYTPQVPRLFSETLRDNILLGLPEKQVDLPGALRAAALEVDLARLPDGLATPVGPRGVRLSGGQVQRAAAARMLVRDADLLVVDDLSSALDVETERLLWARLHARPDLTLLAVSNHRAALRHADRVIVLEEGRVVADGPLTALLASSPALRRLWADDEGTPGTVAADAPDRPRSFPGDQEGGR